VFVATSTSPCCGLDGETDVFSFCCVVAMLGVELVV
jgi:hypothetical protein